MFCDDVKQAATPRFVFRLTSHHTTTMNHPHPSTRREARPVSWFGLSLLAGVVLLGVEGGNERGPSPGAPVTASTVLFPSLSEDTAAPPAAKASTGLLAVTSTKKPQPAGEWPRP